jgi:hypothetical protein
VAHDTEITKANYLNYWSKPYPKDEFVELHPPAMCNRVINPQTEHDIFYLKPSIWSAIYLRSFLENNDIDFLETPGASFQDSGFSFKSWISARRIWLVHQGYLHYRQDNETSSVNNPSKVYCIADEYHSTEAYLAQRPDKQRYLTPVLTKMKYDTYIWNLERIATHFRLDFAVHMQSEFQAAVNAGRINWSLFEPWKKQLLLKLLASPEDFLLAHEASQRHGYLAKAIHYLKAGGMGALTRVIFRRLRHVLRRLPRKG